MLPVWAIVVMVAVAAGLVAIGVLLAMTIERRRHRQLLQAHGLTRGLSRYHRPQLSANERNYSHITPPTTHLRRSIQMPYGIISLATKSNAGEDEEKQSENPRGHPEDYTEVLRPHANRRMRRSFKGQPLHVPKTRRNGKLRKAMPLNQTQKSPLSAITEFSDPPTSTPSDVGEFHGHSTTMLLPDNALLRPGKDVSTQWPLAPADTRGSDLMPTEIVEVAARESVIARRGVAAQRRSTAARFVAIPDSVSEASITSTAPADPLPPLPKLDFYKRVKSHDLMRRSSNTSLDTIGSSVLGAYVSSPANVPKDPSAFGNAARQRSPAFDLALKQEFATPQLQAPAVKKAIHGLVSGKSIHSLHPSLHTDESSPTRSHRHHPELPTIIASEEESFKTIDASTWNLPPLKVDKLRSSAGQPYRHSMIEPLKLAQWRAVTDPTTGLLADDDVFAIGAASQRPKSVATGNPLQWGTQPPSLNKRHSLTSLDGAKRGHKRQNCIRITNLPILAVKPSIERLPELTEEQQHPNADQESNNVFEIKQPRPMYQPRPLVMDRKTSPSPSPFKNAPILTPTPRPARKQYIQPWRTVASSLRKPASTPRPDSDAFNSTHMDMPLSSPYNDTPGRWPLSPTARAAGQETPTSVRQTPFESPILPSPALNSALLYPRKTLVKGPRSPPGSGRNSCATSTSPLHNKQGHSYRVTKDRDSNGQVATGLRKSVMMLRSMHSQFQLLDQRSNQPDRPESGDSSAEISALPAPPLNKRIMGLKTSSCAPSAINISAAPSPTLEKHQSLPNRGSSPLATTPPSNPNILPGARANAGLDGKLSPTPNFNLRSSQLSASHSMRVPSMMSTGGASIWEDMSVRAESPDPLEADDYRHGGGEKNRNEQTALRTLSKTDHNQRNSSAYPSRSSSHARRQSHSYTFPTIVARDFGASPSIAEDEIENVAVHDDDHVSPLVQRIERAASSAQWNRKMYLQGHSRGRSSTISNKQSIEQDEPVTPRTRREMDVFGGGGGDQSLDRGNMSLSKKEPGIGLGLRLDNLIVGRNYINR